MYVAGASLVQSRAMRKKIVLLHGSFRPLLMTMRCSTCESLRVIEFQVARSVRRHCRSPINLPFPRLAEVDLMLIVVVRVTPLTELTVNVTPVVALTKPAM